MQTDLEPNARIDAAVDWILVNPVEGRPRATTPVLKELFGLTTVEAVTAIREANRIRYGIGEARNDAS